MLNSDIRSTAELLSIALAAEREAMRRYAELAGSMQEAGNLEVGKLFESMVVEEQAHEQQLTEWATLAGITINTDIEPVRWDDPGVATIYDAEACNPHLSTPYKALAFAVHNEERGFRFYSYVAAHSRDPGVCDAAETLAREELAHATLLRAQRRRAWHAQRQQLQAVPDIDPATIHTSDDLLVATVSTEQYIAALMDALSKQYPDLKPLAASTRERLSRHEETDRDSEPGSTELAVTLQELYAACERSFALYDAVVTLAKDEALMLAAQQQSAIAMQRIADLRRLQEF
jgi:rubrerythrin